MTELSYRTALVTGASSGLGRGLALWLGRRGVKVYAAARRRAHLEALAREAEATGAHIKPVELDVSHAEATLERVRELDEACGGLDLVWRAAGAARHALSPGGRAGRGVDGSGHFCAARPSTAFPGPWPAPSGW